MIRIVRDILPPGVLTSASVQKLLDKMVAGERLGYNGESKITFEASVYGHKLVKEALIKAQYGKCCFCESKITHIAYGDVEHFRPKGGFCQQPNGALVKPGYYWLAYNWENLLLCCQLCNQRNKRNYFPLSNPQRRARSSRQSIRRERPLFINPGCENPLGHIVFKREIAVPKRGSKRGTITIDALGLNRSELTEIRRSRFEVLWELRQLVVLGKSSRRLGVDIKDLTGKARKLLMASAHPSGEYSSMVMSLLKEK